MNFVSGRNAENDLGPGARERQLSTTSSFTVAQDDEIDLFALAAQLLARKWTLLFILSIGLIGGAFVGQLPPNEYQGKSVVQIEQRSSGMSALPSEIIGELLPGETTDSSLETETHIITSRLILDPVVEALELDLRVIPVRAPIIGHMMERFELPLVDGLLPDRYVRPADSVAVESFLVSDDLRGAEFRLAILGDGQVRLTGPMDRPEQASVTGAVGDMIRLGDDVELVIAQIAAPEGRHFTLIREPLWKSADRLLQGLSVTVRRDSEVADFVYTGASPDRSRAIVNEVVASYKNQNLSRRSAEIDQTIAFIEQQLPDVEASLDGAVRELSTYQQNQQSEELSLRAQELLQRAVRLESSLNEFQFREQLLLEQFTPDHPDVRSLRAGKSQIQARLAELREALSDIPEAERQLFTLTQNVERARELGSQLKSRVEQLRILKASTVANIRVLAAADNARLVGPRRSLPMLIGGVLALLLGAAAILLVNRLGRGIEGARAIEDLGLSLFATIGKVKGAGNARAGMPGYAIAQSAPTDLAVESLRGLRTGLQFSLAATGSKSLMMTSCAPGDGKSFVSLNLALVSAEAGNRVLLVDCDLRRGELGRHFGLERNAPGFSDFLAGTAAFGDIIIKDADTGLEFIGTGRFPPNPSELLATPRFASLLAELSDHYDLIVLDAPPVLAVTDPGIIGQSAGMSLLVVSHLRTTAAEIQSAQKLLSVSGVHLSGVVLNQFDQKKSAYGKYGARYGYSGGYSYTYR